MDLDDTPEKVDCHACGPGTYAEMIYDLKEFEKMPKMFDRQQCSVIVANVSKSSCIYHQRKWRAHLDSLRVDTGIPSGLRISIGGNVNIVSEYGYIELEFETYKLRRGEEFVVFIDSVEVLKIDAGDELDSAGFSVQRADAKEFRLEKGEHLIQFSAESKIEPDVIFSYWDT